MVILLKVRKKILRITLKLILLNKKVFLKKYKYSNLF